MLKMNKRAARFILISSFISTSHAMININPTLISIADDRTHAIITISNPNDYKSYGSMETEAYTCKNKSMVCEGDERIQNNEITEHILFSTNKFILNPGQTKKIHVSWNGELPNEPIMVAYYAEDHAEEAVTQNNSAPTDKDNKHSFSLGVKTRQLAHMLVLQAGTEEKEPTISIGENSYTITNNGSAPLLSRFSQPNCTSDSEDCKKGGNVVTLQPGSTKEYSLNTKYDASTRYFYNNAWVKDTIASKA